MNNQVIVNNASVAVKEYQGQRVVTFKEIDAVHGRPDGTARKRFNENRSRFIEGEDYFVRKTDEAFSDYGITAPNGLTLITESGYLMLAKSLTDDLAWEVQRKLVKSYFRVAAKPMTQLEMLAAQAQAMVEQERKVAALAERVDRQEEKIDKAVSVFSLPTVEIEDWSRKMNAHIGAVCAEYQLNHASFRGESYRMLEEKANVSLSSRLTRKQNRMRKAGCKASERNAVTKLSIIAEDAKLRSIYEGIVRKCEAQLYATGRIGA